MHKAKSRHIVLAGLCLTVFLLAVMICWALAGSSARPAEPLPAALGLVGEYCPDGGGWLPLDDRHPFTNKGYQTVVFRGRFSGAVPQGQALMLFLRNVWGELRINNRVVASNLKEAGARAPTAPGYSIVSVPAADIPAQAEVELTLTNPYVRFSRDPFTETLPRMAVGSDGALYAILMREKMPALIIGACISFMSVFSFFSAAIFWRESRRTFERCLALSFFSLCGGLFVLTDIAHACLPLLTGNSLLCTIMDIAPVHFCVLSGCLYIWTNTVHTGTRRFMTAATLLSMLSSAAAFCLQLFGMLDLYPSQALIIIPCILGACGGAVCLGLEAFRWKDKNASVVFWCFLPVISAVPLELVNHRLALLPARIVTRLGILTALLLLLIQLFCLTKKRAEETEHYQRIQNELLQSRVAIMLSQIKPHFLYNALNTIQYLCETQPKQASLAIGHFSKYLRRNMDSLSQKTPISLTQEIEHLENYLFIERLRFQDIQIQYDLRATHFSLPTLTLQSLVENAINHGVRQKSNGGRIDISSWEDGRAWYVRVADDGVGFDPTTLPEDGRSHIGISNMRSRLKSMCNGELQIDSSPECGTRATIIIPKEAVR